METVNETGAATPRRRPWNKGKLIGPKPPLPRNNVWATPARLRLAGHTRDLQSGDASKLRGCDVVSLGRERRATRL